MATMNDTVLLITGYGIGQGPEDLRLKLAVKYFQLLEQASSLPGVVCLYTDGVKMVVEGSPVLELLKSLEEKGIRLVVCSTCLEYFQLTEKVRAGIVGSMADIQEAQFRAAKVISL
jgi:hypothetical protein